MGNSDLLVNIYHCPNCHHTVAEYWQDGRYSTHSTHDDSPENIACWARGNGHVVTIINYKQAYQPQRNNPAQ